MPDTPISPVFFLVFGFVLAIVLQAWFVRRLSYLRGKTRESKELCDRLHAEATSLAESVAEFSRGLDSNTTSVQMLEREIEELKAKIAGLEGAPGEGETGSGEAADQGAARTSPPPAATDHPPVNQDVNTDAPALAPPIEGAETVPPETSASTERSGDESGQA